MNEQQLIRQAAAQLRHAGFVVQEDVQLLPARGGRKAARHRADLVVWAALEDALAPFAVVEVRRQLRPADVEAAVAQLTAYQNLVGAPRALVYDGAWHEPEALSGRLTPVPLPSPASATETLPPSAGTLEQAVRAELWKALDAVRGHQQLGPEMLAAALDRSLASDAWPTSVIAQMLESERGRQAVAAVVADELERLDRVGAQSATPNELNVCLTNLLFPTHGTVLDPFCGTASTLRSVAKASAEHVTLSGVDVNSGALHLAEILNRITGVHVALRLGDSLSGDLPPADFVVSEPPIGLRLQTPVTLSDGSTTKDGDCAVVDACVRALAPGGRAVLVTGPSLLTRDGDSARLRRSIATSCRLVAVLRLPSGALGGTSIGPAVLVIERREPTDTLFAVLEEDWSEQLQHGGEVYTAYLSHLGPENR